MLDGDLSALTIPINCASQAMIARLLLCNLVGARSALRRASQDRILRVDRNSLNYLRHPKIVATKRAAPGICMEAHRNQVPDEVRVGKGDAHKALERSRAVGSPIAKEALDKFPRPVRH